jgi:hypothetical protein
MGPGLVHWKRARTVTGLALGVATFWVMRVAYWRATREVPFSDIAAYQGIARHIYLHWEFNWNSFWWTFKPPVHPLLIATSWFLTGGESEWAWRVAQATLTLTATLWLAWEIRVATDRTWLALGLVWIVAVAKPSVFWSYKLAQEGTAEAFIYLCAAAVLWAVRRPNPWRFSLLGVLFTTAILNRPQFLVYLPLLPALLFLVRGKVRHPRRLVALTLAFLLAVGITWSPWIARSYALYGAFVPISTQGPYSFLWDLGQISVDVPGVGRIVTDAGTLLHGAAQRFSNEYEAYQFANRVAHAWLQANWTTLPDIVAWRAQRTLFDRTIYLTKVSRTQMLPGSWDRFLIDKGRWSVVTGMLGLSLLPWLGVPALLLLPYIVLAPWLFSLFFFSEPRLLEPSLPLILYGNLALMPVAAAGVRGALARGRWRRALAYAGTEAPAGAEYLLIFSGAFIALAGVALRASCVTYGPAQIVCGGPTGDAWYWHELAARLAEGRGVDSYLRPGYSILLGAVYQLLGPKLLVAQFVNAGLLAAALTALYALGRAVWGWQVGVVTILALAASLGFTRFALSPVTENLGLAVAAGAAGTLVAWQRTRRTWLLIAVGLLIGTGAISRPEVVFPAYLVTLWILVRARRSWRGLLPELAILHLAVAAPVVPWLVIQKDRFGTVSLSGNDMEVLYAATSRRYGRWTGREAADALREGQASPSPSSLHRYFRRQTVQNLVEDPGFYVGNVLGGARQAILGWPQIVDRRALAVAVLLVAAWATTHRRGWSERDAYATAACDPHLPELSRRLAVVAALTLACLGFPIALAVAGSVLVFGAGGPMRTLVVWPWLAIVVNATFGLSGLVRLTLSYEPFLVILALYAAARIAEVSAKTIWMVPQTAPRGHHAILCGLDALTKGLGVAVLGTIGVALTVLIVRNWTPGPVSPVAPLDREQQVVQAALWPSGASGVSPNALVALAVFPHSWISAPGLVPGTGDDWTFSDRQAPRAIAYVEVIGQGRIWTIFPGLGDPHALSGRRIGLRGTLATRVGTPKLIVEAVCFPAADTCRAAWLTSSVASIP